MGILLKNADFIDPIAQTIAHTDLPAEEGRIAVGLLPHRAFRLFGGLGLRAVRECPHKRLQRLKAVCALDVHRSVCVVVGVKTVRQHVAQLFVGEGGGTVAGIGGDGEGGGHRRLLLVGQRADELAHRVGVLGGG